MVALLRPPLKEGYEADDLSFADAYPVPHVAVGYDDGSSLPLLLVFDADRERLTADSRTLLAALDSLWLEAAP